MKRQWISAILMVMTGWCIFAASDFYKSQPVIITVSEIKTTDEDIISVQKDTFPDAAEDTLHAETEEDAPYQPAPDDLNLAHYFPDGEDTSDLMKSYAGKAFIELMTQDQFWIGKIYDYADIAPEQLALYMGKPRSTVLGKYNPKDDCHDPEDPDTWTINSFRDMRIRVFDGDNQPISLYSNVIEIMSMANVYTYYKGVEDYDLFIAYCKALWDKSHSYSISISDIEYCDGCLTEEDERKRLEREAEAEEANVNAIGNIGHAAEDEGGFTNEEQKNIETHVESGAFGADGRHITTDSESTTAQSSTTESTAVQSAITESTATQSATTESTAAQSTTTESAAAQSATTESTIAKNTTAETDTTYTTKGSENGVEETDKGSEAAGSENAAETTERTAAHFEGGAAGSKDIETTQKNAAEESSPVIIAGDTYTGDAGNTEQTATPSNYKESSSQSGQCPGHVDLIVQIRIRGVNEKNGLFKIDSYGNDPDNFEEDGWQGWSQESIAAAKSLSSQNWYEKYKMTVSMISFANPLTSAEIEAYLNRLPASISQTRRDLIRFALSSVGKVPYYWGGKPSAPNYSRNAFGSLVSPDYKGRVLKGLDCSGWISWVYWSVTGKRLLYESTSGLALCGSPVSRSNLQPGDIILRTGENAHVIMFLEWTEDGKIRCIHESSGDVNNVTVSVRDANWPYYRKLID